MLFGQIAGSGLRPPDNADIHFSPNNTKDISPASMRPCYVRAGTAVVTAKGATRSPRSVHGRVRTVFFDSTLSKGIWSAGSAWIYATGATV